MDVDQLKSQRKTKKISFNNYAKRRDAIKKILKSLDYNFNDNVNSICSHVNSCAMEFSNGLKGNHKIANVHIGIDESKEKYISYDSKMSGCEENLRCELNRCQKKINDLDYEIKQLENKIKEQGGTIYSWE